MPTNPRKTVTCLKISYTLPSSITLCSLCIIFVSNQAKQWFLFFSFRIVPPPNRAYLRTLIHNGDLEHLEKVVLDGHGAKLMHETSALDKVSKFIYALPDFMVRTRCPKNNFRSDLQRKINCPLNVKKNNVLISNSFPIGHDSNSS